MCSVGLGMSGDLGSCKGQARHEQSEVGGLERPVIVITGSGIWMHALSFRSCCVPLVRVFELRNMKS